ncbi:uncharacterized protein LOC109834522 [Asparagus officinalis]|uniref:uncharacterized protein LOC109834522 n=1 Tax=Asparagus officinalis TaxID=4686 RepID=UPI00098E5542|nr:uncharacterized protein LOC109834522 [Asparagus officinalis]
MAFTKFYGVGLIFLYLALRGNGGVDGTETGKRTTMNKDSHKIDGREKVPFRGKNYASNDNLATNAVSNRLEHFAIYRSGEGQYGTEAELVVYALPKVQHDQFTTVSIDVVGGLDGPVGDFNSIVAGWHVYPLLYNDTDTHFFTYWTADGYRATGCYNLQCEGFVPRVTTPSKLPGFKIYPVSEYNGFQVVVKVKIYKDEKTENWWLYVDDSPIGYWPKTLFKSLSESAQEINWGGSVDFGDDEESPLMGSGHFPEEGESRAAAIQNIRFVNKHGELYNLTRAGVRSYVDRSDCYRVGEFFSEEKGFKFYFGGLGGILGSCAN